MARNARRAARAAERAAKKHPKLVLGVIIFLVIVIAVCACLYFFVFKEEVDNFLAGLKKPSDTDGTGTEIAAGDLAEISSADLSIHFIAPAVKASGDSALIKVGDTEVLIDAGPTQGNVTEIKEYLDEYCTDGVLEYVIVTHADTDHIAGMVGTSSGGSYNGILYSYDIGTVITFDRTDKKLETAAGNPTLYARYLTAFGVCRRAGRGRLYGAAMLER